MGCGRRSLKGHTYRSKRWASRWAKSRRVYKVKGGWRIGKKR